MVKIIHMSDTHLGYRAKRGAINKWAIDNYSRPYEQEIYDTFKKVMEDISNLKDIDFVVHCGDMFHIPSLNLTYTPPEPARRALIEGLEIFFTNTINKVPFIYIEGNHGVFRKYDYTPFESHINKENYPNIFYYKEKDLINSIKSDKPLNIEFKEKRVRFYLFPYFEFNSFEGYKSIYDKWVENQKPPNDDYINIAVAHGSKLDGTLHEKVRSDDFGYDYIALGHEHGLREESRNRYYSGSLLPLNFKEIIEKQGYLIVNIDDSTKRLKVEKVFTDILLKRPFSLNVMDISPQDTSAELRNKILNKLRKFTSKKGFNSMTSARVKINFKGEFTFNKIWQINDTMSKIRRECFSETEKYNIMQLIWKISNISKYFEDDISSGRIIDYILKNPSEEFKQFVNEKLSDEESEFDVEKLTQFGIKTINYALKIMDKEKEV